MEPVLNSLIAKINLLTLASLSDQSTSDSWEQTTTTSNNSGSWPSSSFSDEFSHSPTFSPSITKMHCIRINGRKIIGPPLNWEGEAPSTENELFLKRIPKDMNDMELLRLFQQFGPVYNLRIMVDFCDLNRGFGYVHFVHKADADKARDVLQHFFIRPFQTLRLEKSYNKSRLFVSNFPRDKSVWEVKAVLMDVFPELCNVVIYKNHTDEGNRGFAFVDFPTHDAAIRAKQQTSMGRCRLFEHDVKVVWANPEHTNEDTLGQLDDVRTLFVRNLHMSLNNRDIFQILSQFVHRTEVQKVARVRDLAFIEFFERSAAEKVKVKLHGYEILNRQLEVAWAIPPKVNNPNHIQHIDHDATLRMKCIANNWLPPVYVFGRIFADSLSQCVAVLLGDGQGMCLILLQVDIQCVDLQSRVAEVVGALIDMNGRFPLVNYVVIVDKNAFHCVGIITCLASATFAKASPIPQDNLSLYWSEMRDMCQCCMLLFQVPRQSLDLQYNYLIQWPDKLTYLPHLNINLRRFGCIHPDYRRRPPLKHGLKCNAIVLALCDIDTGSNLNPVAASLDFPVPLGDAPLKLNNTDDSTIPHPVRYYCVSMVNESQSSDETLPFSVGRNDFRSNRQVLDPPMCAVVFGKHVNV